MKHLLSWFNKIALYVGYYPVAFGLQLFLGGTYRVRTIKNWQQLSHFCYVVIHRNNQSQFFIKVRNPFSSLYNRISGRPHPSTAEQMESFFKLPQNVQGFFPQVMNMHSLIAMKYMGDYKVPIVSELSDADKKYIATETSRMLAELHAAGFVHGDIKLKNMLYHAPTKKLLFIDIDYLQPVTPERLDYEHGQEQALLRVIGFSANPENRS